MCVCEGMRAPSTEQIGEADPRHVGYRDERIHVIGTWPSCQAPQSVGLTALQRRGRTSWTPCAPPSPCMEVSCVALSLPRTAAATVLFDRKHS